MATEKIKFKEFSKKPASYQEMDSFSSLPNCFFSVKDTKTNNLNNSLSMSLPKLNGEIFDTLFKLDTPLYCLKSNHHKNDTGSLGNGNISVPEFSRMNISKKGASCNQKDTNKILKDLDSLRDVDGRTQVTNLNSLETKVEDCLMDLDNYLEKIDGCCFLQEERNFQNKDDMCPTKQKSLRYRNRSLPMTRAHFFQTNSGNLIFESINNAEARFKRHNNARKTISCIRGEKCEDLTKNGKDKEQNLQSEELNIESKAAINPINRHQDFALSVDESESNNFQKHLINEPVLMPTNSELRRCFSQSRLNTAPGRNETLTQEDIFNNIVLQNEISINITDRPRQFGRRVDGRPQVFPTRSEVSRGNQGFIIINHTQRPLSAPTISVRAIREEAAINDRRINSSISSDVSSAQSSGHSSPVTMISSSDSGSIAASVNGNTQVNPGTSTYIQDSPAENIASNTHTGVNDEWPHSSSRALALVCCTLGLFNICRFAVLTIQYGGNFILQFLILSILFGIPLFLLHMCLGSKIKAGPISMWKISPICRGIGIALVIVQCLIAIYSTIAIAWLFIYLRDSFPSSNQSSHMFEKIINLFHKRSMNSSNIAENISDYFNVVVLQRFNLLQTTDGLKFHINNWMTFNLAIIWVIVFVILCKGLKLYGKAVFMLTILPLIVLVAVVCKLLYVINPAKLQNIFTTADFDEFLVNSKTWIAAAQEVFITWGLLGTSVISITSRTNTIGSRQSSLRRDAIFAILITLFGLCVAALLGTCCIQILNQQAYIYVPGSFENLESSKAVFSIQKLTNASVLSFPSKWMHHYSSFIGESYRRHYSQHESGYQAVRFLTEIFPSVIILSHKSISWIWAVMAFIAFIMLGISQLSAMWKPLLNSLEHSISSVLLCCVTALLLGVPFTTEIGISVLYYFDFVLGGSWFITILWTAQIFGVFLIRGRPYNGDDLVNDLKMSSSLSAFTALSWNVLLPIGLISLSIINYKISFSNQFYYWRGKSYFNYWTKKVAASIQIGFLLIVPITAIIQIYRYLTSGPSDILDRIQLLYRPGEGLNRYRNGIQIESIRAGYGGRSIGNHTIVNAELRSAPPHMQDDSPPKYTPPPSYTTATGARFAKILRQSIRRSIRRILCERGRLGSGGNTINSYESNSVDLHSPVETDQPSTSSNIHRSYSLGQNILAKPQISGTARSTSGRNRVLQSPFTANDVVAVLRSSTTWGRRAIGESSSRELHELHPQNDASFHSIDNLITNAESIDQCAAVTVCRDQAESDTSVI